MVHGISGHRLFARDDAAFNWTSLTPSATLNWTSCYEDFQCARLAVPLRYSDPSGEQAAVAIIKSPSDLSPTDDNYKGPILFNPGGPGGSGVDTILGSASQFHGVLGGQFDLYGFDPRGISRTTPVLSIFSDPVEAGTFYVQQESDLNSTESSLGMAFAQSTIFGKLAVERAQEVARTVSTPTVARDMLSIVKAAGYDKLQYWGFSYGSVLGATFAAMFPENVGRLIIDGIEDAEAYYAGNQTSNLLDTDKALTQIFDACVQAGPDLCAIYENTTDLVRSRVDTLMNKLRTDPVPLFNSSAIDSVVVDYGSVREQIRVSLYTPYTTSANLTAALEQGDGSLIYAGSRKSSALSLLANECQAQSDEPFVAGLWDTTGPIVCGDALSDAVPSIDDVRASYRELLAVSPDFGGTWLADSLCSGWTIRGDERFNGSFVQNTSFPLLIIGNVADPVTPLVNAQKMSQRFTDSVVLTQNSTGHCSIAAVSTCTMQAVRAYFVNGTLPKQGTVCEIESTIFGNSSSDSISLRVRDVGNEGTNLNEENALLRAARGLQRAGIVAKRNGVGRKFL